MAARNTTDNRRFVYRLPDKEPEPYFIPINRSGSIISQPVRTMHPPPKIIRSSDLLTPRTEVAPSLRTDIATPPRRIVVIRNTKNPQVDQGPVDLGDLGRSKSFDVPPAFSDGNKSLFLIRRHISPPEPSKSVESIQPVQEVPPTNSSEYLRVLSPPQQPVLSSEPPRSPSRGQSPPPMRPKSSKQRENSQHQMPHLRRSRSKIRTPSPVPTNSTRQSPSPSNRWHPKTPPHLSSPLKQEEPKETGRKRSFFSFFSKKSTTEPVSLPPPVITENEQQTVQQRPVSPPRSAQRKRSSSSRSRSAKSVVFADSNDQPVTVAENSYVKREPLKSALKRPKSVKKTRFEDEISNQTTEKLLKTSRRQRCLGCLSRYMCLIIIICFLLVLIGLAGVGVSAYFLATGPSTYLAPKIVGIVIGGVLVIAALSFLYILLGCIGIRDGYFTYKDDGSHKGGRAFALIRPSHKNAHLYIPREYMKMVENDYPSSSASVSNVVYNQPQLIQPASTVPYVRQPTIHRSNTTISNRYENKSNKNNVTIEMPEQLLTGREMSPKSRERSINKVVRNIGHVVEDAKKRYNGDVPNKVIIKVDKNATQTA